MHISADFITKLLLAQGYNSFLVVVDRLTKIVHFIPTIEKTSAEGLARLFRDNVWKLHSLPYQKGLQFAAGLMQELNRMLGIESKMFVRATGAPDSRRILSDITVYNYDTTRLQENPQRLG